MSLKHFIQITKPGIIFGNVLSVAGGFFLASKGNIDFSVFLAAVIGTSLVVASGCVFNNCIDRDIDQRMERTRNRVLVQGLVSLKLALLYATVLGVAGVALLYTKANPLAALFAVIGFVIYVGFYSLYLKRRSVHGTLVGSLSGAMPPVIGYCAVSNSFDFAALTLLVMFSLWQMPHSYAIAIFRFNDYSAAKIPVLPVKRGILVTKRHILLYILAFLVATLMLTVGGYAGLNYLAVAAGMGMYWLYMAWKGYKAVDDTVWARKLFVFSIFTITALSVMMSVDFQVTKELLVTYAF
ncbi:Protoheme IX farnesyltransferase [Pseudomonas tremae]|uniref:Protoheme IX farnesyltransferase n=3 Tax=Pseudomonas syringae group TaxID=136849 RepID=A0AA40P155_9PSED|nr:MULTISPECIES: heme o synthase [Pseudomonas syringae group]KGS16280.1 protoheme IX farnesyltransferase [Pseudomonas coronafaciens]KPB52836.1 Protoheme IX farnesyltransferase [Pseudomonas coronafaciens pv. oryzae]KPW35395.1 Protoheme IX farnesyltransferase [Pseudomonas coronafaciens pv. atropurpurea]KPY08803.1 Protoheme IX farnesyltransferase [Pseudomonas coronafaciens pv. oryzae]KPY94331.1 Protoheme IX farnesyltransferase [Pseudomonas tremae]